MHVFAFRCVRASSPHGRTLCDVFTHSPGVHSRAPPKPSVYAGCGRASGFGVSIPDEFGVLFRLPLLILLSR